MFLVLFLTMRSAFERSNHGALMTGGLHAGGQWVLVCVIWLLTNLTPSH